MGQDGKAWLALVEMPESLRDKKDDPYTRVYRSIAAIGGLSGMFSKNAADKLKEVATTGADERIYVRGANQVNYGRIAEVMSVITAAGYKKVALVTDPNKN